MTLLFSGSRYTKTLQDKTFIIVSHKAHIDWPATQQLSNAGSSGAQLIKNFANR
jgi:hypothetical protein